MKNIKTTVHLKPNQWLIYGLIVIASVLLLSTYSNHASAGITDFVKDELVGCKIFNYPDATEQLIWKGACVDGSISGMGILMSKSEAKKIICQHFVADSKSGLVDGLVRSDCSNGIRMDNYFAQGVLHGKGSISSPNGEKVETEYDRGELVRRGDQTFAASSKTKNQGIFQNDQRNGQSVQTLPNGEKRVGEFKDGDIVKGVATTPDHPVYGQVKYEGEFQNGMPHGKGKTTRSGSTYEGGFENGQRNGIGRLVYVDGDYQVGLFKNGNYVPGSGTEKDTIASRMKKAEQREKDRKFEFQTGIRLYRIDW